MEWVAPSPALSAILLFAFTALGLYVAGFRPGVASVHRSPRHASSADKAPRAAAAGATSGADTHQRVDDGGRDEDETGGVLRILSHNVWAHYLVFAPARTRRLDALATRVGECGAAVVAVQELFLLRCFGLVLARHFNRFAEQMAAHGLRYHTDPLASLPRAFGQNSGLVIFSRYPLADEAASAFVSAEAVNSKGVVSARVVADGRSLAVVNCHLDAPRRPLPTRQGQLAHVARVAAERRAAGSAVVACGDWNSCPYSMDDGTFELLQSAMERARLPVNAGGPPFKATLRAAKPVSWRTTRGAGGTGPVRALDHLFASNDVTVVGHELVDWRDDGGLGVSDHLGVLVDVQLSRAT